jgi:ADP-ribose pyrophosphatase YjhB (NUDIX family)
MRFAPTGASGQVGEAGKVGKGAKVKAVCAFRHADRLLVIENVERDTGQTTCKLPGGTVELGETTYDCVVREIREELDAEIRNVDRLGVIEAVFQTNGQLRHQIVFVYQATFDDPSFYAGGSLRIREGKKELTASWKPFGEFCDGKTLLRPQGLLNLLGEGSKITGEGGALQLKIWRRERA